MSSRPLPARDLADPAHLPTDQPGYDQTFDATRLVLGQMFAAVSIIVTERTDIRLLGYGDAATLQALKTTVIRGALRITAPLPTKQSSKTAWLGNFGRASITFSRGGQKDALVINGRAIDLDRQVRLVLEVPPNANVTVDRLVGQAGLQGAPAGTLCLVGSLYSDVYAEEVHDLLGSLGSGCTVEVGQVTGNIKVSTDFGGSLNTGDIQGSARLQASTAFEVNLGCIQGDLVLRTDFGGQLTAKAIAGDIDIHGGTSAKVIIEGGTSASLKAELDFSGEVTHHGSVGRLEPPKLNVGSKVRANGQTFEWSPFGNPRGGLRAPRAPRAPRPPS